MAIRTIFTMAEDCAHGERQGWTEFVRDYGDICQTILAHYFPGLASEVSLHVQTVFARANADQNAWFRSLHFANEREFSMSFRALVFDYGHEFRRVPPPEIAADTLPRAQEGMTLVQRQIFWLYLRGWDAGQTSAILMNAAATALETKAMVDKRLASLLPADSLLDRLAAVRSAIKLAEDGHTADCLSWKTMDNIINGQIAWRDREAAERHMTGCNHCLNAFTSFQEMIWLRKTSTPIPEAEIEKILKRLRLRAPKGLLSRLLAG